MIVSTANRSDKAQSALSEHAAAETPEFRRRWPPHKYPALYLPPDQLALYRDGRRRGAGLIRRLFERLRAGRANGR